MDKDDVVYTHTHTGILLSHQKSEIMPFVAIWVDLKIIWGFPGSSGKESFYQRRNEGPIPDPGRSSGEGNGNPLQYSFLENPRDRGAW